MQGDDYAATVTVTNTDGSSPDLTGYTAKAQIRRDVADEERTVAAEITAVVQTPLVQLSIPHTLTQKLADAYVWDLQLISPTGAITTILAGSVSVKAEVTR